MKKVEVMTHLVGGILAGRSFIHPDHSLPEIVQTASQYADAILQGSEKDLAVAVGSEERGRCLGLVHTLIERYRPPDDKHTPVVTVLEVVDDLKVLYNRIRDGK